MATLRRSALLTQAQVDAPKPVGTKLSDGAGRGEGRLVVRWGEGTKRWFYFRYTGAARRRFAIPLPASSLKEARRLIDGYVDGAGQYVRGYAQRAREARAEGRDLREVLNAERVARERAEQDARDADARAARLAERGTLRVLLDAYVAHLQAAGKPSAGDVRRAFERYIHQAHPQLSARQAAGISAAELAAAVRVCAEGGHLRTAMKLRAFLRAAYALAQGADTAIEVPSDLVELGIEFNPAAAIKPIRVKRSRDRVLTPGELGYYLHALEQAPDGPARDALWLALWLGGQRMAQLLRVRPGDVDLVAGTITLYDGKGRRAVPRLHLLPLSPRGKAVVQRRLAACGEAPWLFTHDGKTSTRIETVEALATPILAAMLQDEDLRRAREVGVGQAQLRDVRRTCETMLAGLRISKDVRAQLLSHGIGGVQDQHYDRYDYFDEKRAALLAWEAHLDALLARQRARMAGGDDTVRASNVVGLEQARARRRA